MANENPQKIKLLKIMEMLTLESDEESPLRTNQIISKLGEFGISCERRTIPLDIELLNKFGYGISSTMVGHEKAYYVRRRNFSVPELKILIDAVQAAKFIPEDRTTDMVAKIASLGGSHKAEILKSNMVCFTNYKHSNSEVFNSISLLEKALLDHKKASFYYFDLNEAGQKVYRRKRARHVVNPMALIFNNDNYYLITFASKSDGIYRYRVDRMEQVFIENEDVAEEAIIDRSDLAEFNRKAVQMYGGPSELVTLEFDGSIIGAIHDRFGEDAAIKRVQTGEKTSDNSGLSDKYRITADIQISPTFWGWIFQFVGKMKIISPPSVIEEYQERLMDAIGEIGGRIG